MLLAICVLAGVSSGALLRVLVGWLGSGERFNLRKFLSTVIPAEILALPSGLALMKGAMAVDNISLIIIGINSLLTGWAVPDLMKQLNKPESKL